MKAFLTIAFLYIITFIFAFTSNAVAPENLNKKNVIVLNAYHQNYHWADEIMRGIFTVFDDKKKVELFVEYMDTKRCSDSVYYEQLANIYKHKYNNVAIDAIIACDDNALNFLLKYRQEVFPDIPVSFNGIVDYSNTRLQGQKGYTGVHESFDLPANIRLIKKLHPKVKEIVFVSDLTESGKALIARMNRAVPQFENQLKFTYLINEDLEVVKSKISSLSDSSIIIWAIYMRLPNGQFMSSNESIYIIKETSQRPVYCIWDVVGQGVIGGKISPPFYQGYGAANKARQILAGISPDSISIDDTPILFKFDYNELKKFNIRESDLPEGSAIINKPFSFWAEYKLMIIGVFFAFAFLIALVFMLFYLYRKSKKDEVVILKRNQELKQISETLKQTNEHLQFAKYKAEESDRLKSAFLANISHEIRTPMNGILGFSSLLQMGGLDHEDELNYLQLIEKSGQRMVSLLNDLVDMAKIESGTLTLHKSTFNIKDLLKDIKDFYTPEAKEKNLELIVELNHESKDDTITTDKSKVEQVLVNLVKNGLKFSPGGHVKISYKNSPDTVTFFVEDTGIGIPEDELTIIFERFRQSYYSKDNTQQGIGLGLAISKEFVELMGGELKVVSKENEGSTFWFSVLKY